MKLSAADETFRLIQRELGSGDRLGVSEIATRIGKPVSTVHKYLTKSGQSTFIQGRDRRWSVSSAVFGVDGWPLDKTGGETEPETEIKEWIESPIDHITDILSFIKRADEISDIMTRRADFFRQLVEAEMRKRDV